MLNHVVSDDTQQYWVNGNWTYVLEHDDDFSKQEYVMKVIKSSQVKSRDFIRMQHISQWYSCLNTSSLSLRNWVVELAICTILRIKICTFHNTNKPWMAGDGDATPLVLDRKLIPREHPLPISTFDDVWINKKKNKVFILPVTFCGSRTMGIVIWSFCQI